MLRIGAFAFLLSTAALACGCAGAPAESPPLLVNEPPPLANDTAAFSGYQLSEEETKYDRKKLTDKMQVRILQMRGYDTHAKASTLARTGQAVTTIHEQTLAFVPKALGVIGILLLLLPWIVRSLIDFTTAVIMKMPQVAH